MADVTQIEAAGSVALKATATATYGGAGSAILFGLSANEVAAYGGLIVAIIAGIANALINWHWRRKHYRLAEMDIVERRQQSLPTVHDRRRQSGNINPRVAVAVLTLSASALVGIALNEGYRDDAYIPVPGDVPTIGFGTTDGVRLGDKTTPERALVKLLADASRFEQAVKRCAPVPMHMHEFSAFVSLAYNVGEGAFCASSIPDKLAAGQYEAACRTILDFNKVRDCRKPKVRNARTGRMECPLVPLPGLTRRRQAEHAQCMAAQR